MQQEAPARRDPAASPAAVNDFSLQVATVNGSGSQSANKILMRAIFQMGVPVSGKNLFPSNIAGLPTWFTIRANRHGYVARAEDVDVMVVMNPETALEDMAKVRPGALVVLNADLKLDTTRQDVTVVRVPFQSIVSASCPDPRLRKLVTNIVYVGVLSYLLDIGMDEVKKAMDQVFKGKGKAIAINWDAARAGFAWASENAEKPEGFRVERMDGTAGKIIIDGNAAAAIGCLMAGVSVVAWYPITPSSSLCETLIDYLKENRVTPEGQATFAAIQAEDELAALGMVMGAGWAGARAMTATAGPGLSLMAEFAGMGYYTEIPAVVFDIQRTGPSTGLPTRTQQGDLLSAAFLSHGDTQHIVLLPGSPLECYLFAQQAFDLAERFQTPVFVLSDLDLGMNDWMADPFPYPEAPLDRGKVLDAAALERLGEFARYRDVDGDGIPYRTLPGTPHDLAAYFTRGSGHNEKAQYSERPDDYVSQMDRLARKFETAKASVPPALADRRPGARAGILAYGTSDYAVEEARDRLREAGLETDYMRVRAFPFGPEVREFALGCERVYVIDQNRDGQMHALLRLALPEIAGRLESIRYYTGLPVGAQFLTRSILAAEGGN